MTDVPRKEDLTFVVCGKVLTGGKLRTVDCLASIRRYFPTSTIILSTWQNEPVEDLEGLYDELVLSDATLCPPQYSSLLNRDRPNTGNLQQVSGHAGLSRVKTRWAVKTRTDFILTGDHFLTFYQHWEPILDVRCSDKVIFKRRILAPWLFTKVPEHTRQAYQLSDFFQLGLTEDLLLLWDGHQESEDTMDYFNRHPDSPFDNPEHYNHRYNVEQTFFLNVLRAKLEVYLPRWYCDPKVNEHLEEIHKVYASNVLIGTLFELGLKTRWEWEEPIFEPGTFLSFQILLRWYLEVCDSTNEECRKFLEEHPEPQTKPWTLMRKIRMTLREYQIFWVPYQFIKRNILSRMVCVK